MPWHVFLISCFMLFSGSIRLFAEESTWGGQVLEDKSSWNSLATYYGNWGNIALLQDRFPAVVYIQRQPSSQLRCVEWKDGVKKDELICDVNFNTTAVRIAARGELLAVSWSVTTPSTRHTTIHCTRRVDGFWTEPEVIYSGSYAGWDLDVSPQGRPVAAVYRRNDSGPSPVEWVERVEGAGWIPGAIATSSGYISNIRLIHDAAGTPVVAWRRYSSYNGGPEPTIHYAMRTAIGWETAAPPQLVHLTGLFTGPDGSACLTGRNENYGTRLHRIAPGDPGPAETIPFSLSENLSAAAMTDGTLHIADGPLLLTRRAGTWTSSPAPASHAIRADGDGNLHFLGDDSDLLQYRTLLPSPTPSLHALNTYAQGDRWLEDLARHPDGAPRIFAYRTGGTDEYRGSGATWLTRTVQGAYLGWLYAFDSTGRRHAFDGARYATEDHTGNMVTQDLPVSVTSGSTSTIHAFHMDAADVPNFGFFTGIGTSDVKVHYAVKRAGTWTVENVAPGESTAQHCAIAIDSSGSPWMFTSSGLFRRTSTGWVHEYATTRAENPGLGISSDGTVHAVFTKGLRLHSLTRKNGVTTTLVLGPYSLGHQCAFAMAGDTPLVASVRQLSYSPARDAIVLASKTRDTWQERFITPPATVLEAGEKLRLSATADGRWTIAGTWLELQGHTYRGILYTCQGHLDGTAPAAPRILQQPIPAGGRRFLVDLGNVPGHQPLTLEGSSTLDSWSPLVRFHAGALITPGLTGITLRGDPFRTRITHDLTSTTPTWFIRLRNR